MLPSLGRMCYLCYLLYIYIYIYIYRTYNIIYVYIYIYIYIYISCLSRLKLGLQYDAGDAHDASKDADEDVSDDAQAGVIL